MAAKTVPVPTNLSNLVVKYVRDPLASTNPVTGTYFAVGSQNPGSFNATSAVNTSVDTLVNTVLGYTPQVGDNVVLTIDTNNLQITIVIHATNVDINAQLRQGIFTAGMRTAARNTLAQMLTDGLTAAMGF
jgi:hypothetical protein